MSIESIVLLVTSIAATLKAYFEWKKAKDEAKRADDTEDMLKHTIKSVETAKCNMDSKTKMLFTDDMRKYIEDSSCDTDTIRNVVKEVTKGQGNITKHTIKYNKDTLKKFLED